MTKQIKKSAKNDRDIWLRKLAASGDPKELRRLRKRSSPSQGKLKNLDGEVVDSDVRDQMMAEYFSQVQWATRPTTLIPNRPALYPELTVKITSVEREEVIRAAKKMKSGKASGADGIPIEFWKFLCKDDILLEWMTRFFQHVWTSKKVPSDWYLAQVCALYKKNDPALPSNYRPIS